MISGYDEPFKVLDGVGCFRARDGRGVPSNRFDAKRGVVVDGWMAADNAELSPFAKGCVSKEREKNGWARSNRWKQEESGSSSKAEIEKKIYRQKGTEQASPEMASRQDKKQTR